MQISFIIPSRNNLKYLKWSYAAIRKNQSDHTVQICIADDASTDGTREWLESTSVIDSNLSYIINDTGQRLGHTILYDRLVKEVAKYDLCIIYHADMYLCPGALDAIEKHMYDLATTTEDTHKHLKIIPVPNTIVSLTRIEPPLHPAGPEKIVHAFGTEPENFDEDGLICALATIHEDNIYPNKTTNGIFAPWAFWKSEFLEIGGHDAVYAPQSKEDSDIFNRFKLYGINFIQTWEGFVYHLTCRGSRFNPTLTTPGKNSSEWEEQNIRSTKNFIRKWGTFVKHDEFLNPTISSRYKKMFVVSNPNVAVITAVEPYCDVLVGNNTIFPIFNSIHADTKMDLSGKFQLTEDPNFKGIIVYINGSAFNNRDYEILNIIPEILDEQGQIGNEYVLGNLRIRVNDLTTYENDLIFISN